MQANDTEQLRYLEHLRTKIEQLQAMDKSLHREAAKLKDELTGTKASNGLITTEIEVQRKKNTALNVFVAELQRKHDSQFTDLTNFAPDSDTMSKQKFFLKELLVKRGEEAQQYRTAISCAKSLLDGGRSLQETKFVEEQSEVLVRIASNLVRLRNEDMLCGRKWRNLQRENLELESRLKSLKLQQERQSLTMQQLYEDYLKKVNKNNAQLAYVAVSLIQLNGVGDERTIAEHLIQQVAFVQQERKEVEEERNELRDQQALVQRELETIRRQNQTLKEFFSDRSEESRLASRMKARVEQLMDLRIECRKGSSEPRILAQSKVLENVRVYHRRLQEANNYLGQRFMEAVEGTACIDDVIAGKFFSKLLAEKDERIRLEQKINRELQVYPIHQLQDRINQNRRRKESLAHDTARLASELQLYNLQHRTTEQSLTTQPPPPRPPSRPSPTFT